MRSKCIITKRSLNNLVLGLRCLIPIFIDMKRVILFISVIHFTLLPVFAKPQLMPSLNVDRIQIQNLSQFHATISGINSKKDFLSVVENIQNAKTKSLIKKYMNKIPNKMFKKLPRLVFDGRRLQIIQKGEKPISIEPGGFNQIHTYKVNGKVFKFNHEAGIDANFLRATQVSQNLNDLVPLVIPTAEAWTPLARLLLYLAMGAGSLVLFSVCLPQATMKVVRMGEDAQRAMGRTPLARPQRTRVDQNTQSQRRFRQFVKDYVGDCALAMDEEENLIYDFGEATYYYCYSIAAAVKKKVEESRTDTTRGPPEIYNADGTVSRAFLGYLDNNATNFLDVTHPKDHFAIGQYRPLEDVDPNSGGDIRTEFVGALQYNELPEDVQTAVAQEVWSNHRVRNSCIADGLTWMEEDLRNSGTGSRGSEQHRNKLLEN